MELKIQTLDIKEAVELKNKNTKKRVNKIVSLPEKKREQEYLKYLLSIF